MHLINAQEPARSIGYLIVGFVTAVILAAEPLATAAVALLVAFGALLTPEQIDATVNFVRIFASVLGSALAVKVGTEQTRNRVTPWTPVEDPGPPPAPASEPPLPGDWPAPGTPPGG